MWSLAIARANMCGKSHYCCWRTPSHNSFPGFTCEKKTSLGMRVINTRPSSEKPMFPSGVLYIPHRYTSPYSGQIFLLLESPSFMFPIAAPRVLDVTDGQVRFIEKTKSWIIIDEGTVIDVLLQLGMNHGESILKHFQQYNPEKWRDGTWMIRRNCCGIYMYVEGSKAFSNILHTKLHCPNCLKPAIRLH